MATSNPRKMLGLLLLAGAVVACAPHTLALHVDPVASAGAEHHLDGLRVTVRTVTDKRPESERRAVGRHRDGFLRVQQYRYEANESVEAVVTSALNAALVDAGATIVDQSAATDVVIDVDITALDVTTDGALAGEETFGVVTFDVRISSPMVPLGSFTTTEPFAVDDVQEPTLLKKAIARAASRTARSIRRQSPP